MNYKDTKLQIFNGMAVDPYIQFLKSDAVRYIRKVEIEVNIDYQRSSLEDPNTHLKRFINALGTNLRKRQRHFRVELSGDDNLDSIENQIRLFGLLSHFSRSPGFTDVAFNSSPDKVAIAKRLKTVIPSKKRTFEEYTDDRL